ncbi:MAG TPA: hypothetical protein HA252_01035 [Candidatus Diapherotrites archaeon]|uniref:Glycosyltransferase family 39 protein n=1 Tax=Candidatus Iainarchaeum sp. TaxID=3101447 RepID=A0A7J4JHD7_9ARCH|nr:hypothetical protein [Candidatus Diapherotrites archaeon]HIH15969.1 hypothetical protein [Candidatus Diapherotrites archaeon]
MGETKAIGLLLVVCLAALLVPFARFDQFVSSDLWERQRVSAEILENGFVPEKNMAYSPSAPFLYPPSFDLLLSLAVATGADYLSAVKVLSLAVGVSLAFFAYLLSRRFFRPEIALLSAFFVFFMPRVFRLSLQPIPETLGLLLFVVTLYFASTNRLKLAGLFASALMFYHTRSFFNLLLVSGILFHSLHGVQGLKKMKWLLALPLLFSLAYWLERLPAAFKSTQLLNPFVSEWSLLQVLGPQALLAAFYLVFWWKYARYKPLIHWTGAFVLLYVAALGTGNKTLAFRELTYLFVPVGLLSSALVWRLRALKGFIVPLALLFSLGYAFYLNFNPAYPLEKEGVQALSMASRQGFGAVLTDFVTGYGVPGIAHKKTVIGAFMENLPDANQRLLDAKEFLSTSSPETAVAHMKKYRAGTAFLGRLAAENQWGLDTDYTKFDSPSFNKVYDNAFTKGYSLT